LIILIQKTGQICNQLFYFSHFIAYAIENDIPLYNAAFYEYEQYFMATARNDFGSYRIKILSRWSYLFLNAIKPILLITKSSPFHNFVKISEDQEYNIEDLPKSPVVIPYGWLFRTNALFVRNSDTLRSFFAPVEPYRSNVCNKIAICRKDVDTLIGVHLRRGDYKDWQGGRYFYSDDEYLNIMKQIANQFDGSVGFLLCSNERVDLERFEDLKCYRGGTHSIEDLYSLAECDYKIGPPSTFTLWASFYGNKPYLHIYDAHAPIDMKDFKICQG
jgi:hypothetical protein